MLTTDKIRNIAIIAHVDHGKTTLVDQMLRQSGTFEAHEALTERVMDSNKLEQERGITILAKCTALNWKDYKINVMDTPGHADFGGEVERVLTMVDGVLLLVDSSEGVMPQTKFVLGKALKQNLKPIVVINKIDRSDKRIKEVENEVIDLFIGLGATDEQLDFPFFYGVGRDGWMSENPEVKKDDLSCIFDKVIDYIPTPKIINDDKFRFLGTILGRDPYLGRILTGKVYSGVGTMNFQCKSISATGQFIENAKITKLLVPKGIEKYAVESIIAGDIVTLAGFGDTSVADTICDKENNEPIATLPIDPPTISVGISVNTSPFSGQEGTKVTSTAIEERLFAEAENNVSIKVERSETDGSFIVSGRGELQLGILIENMRREGFELTVSRPKVIFKTDESGAKLEPIEEVVIDVNEEYSSSVIGSLTKRKAEVKEMNHVQANVVRIILEVPSRGLIGYKQELMTATRGTAVLNSVFAKYDSFKGQIESKRNGVLIATEQGVATGYGIFNLQDRGSMFIGAQTKVYEGMIVGEHNRDNDLDINVTKEKQLTNVRSSGTDEAIRLTPPIEMTLETSISYIENDECIEITPKSIRLRKIYLNPTDRKRYSGKLN